MLTSVPPSAFMASAEMRLTVSKGAERGCPPTIASPLSYLIELGTSVLGMVPQAVHVHAWDASAAPVPALPAAPAEAAPAEAAPAEAAPAEAAPAEAAPEGPLQPNATATT